MQNPVPDAPSERPDRQDADSPAVPGETRPGSSADPVAASGAAAPMPVAEIDGPTGPEPTRYGDWERKGRCIDF